MPAMRAISATALRKLLIGLWICLRARAGNFHFFETLVPCMSRRFILASQARTPGQPTPALREQVRGVKTPLRRSQAAFSRARSAGRILIPPPERSLQAAAA